MVRDYSTQAEEELVRISKGAAEEGLFRNALDFAADVCTSVALQFIDKDSNCFNCITEYQATVIDARNIKEKKIRKIFKNCRNEDSRVSSEFSMSSLDYEKVRNALKQIADAISDSGTSFVDSLSDFQRLCSKHQEIAIAADSFATDRLKTSMSTLEKLEFIKSSQAMGKDVLHIVGDFCSLLVDVTCPVKFGNDLYGMLNDSIALVTDTASMGQVGLASLSSKINPDTKYDLEALEEAERLRGEDSLADYFSEAAKDAGFSFKSNGKGNAGDNDVFAQTFGFGCEVLSHFSRGLDIVSGGISVITGIGDFAEGLYQKKHGAELSKLDKKLTELDRKYGKLDKRTKEAHEINKQIEKVTKQQEILKKGSIGSGKLSKMEEMEHEYNRMDRRKKEARALKKTMEEVNKFEKQLKNVNKTGKAGQKAVEYINEYVTTQEIPMKRENAIETTSEILGASEKVASINGTDGKEDTVISTAKEFVDTTKDVKGVYEDMGKTYKNRKKHLDELKEDGLK